MEPTDEVGLVTGGSREIGRSIVNYASVSALHGVAGHRAYAASTAGMPARTRYLAGEVGRFGIPVNAVVPDRAATAMTSGLSDDAFGLLRSRERLPDGGARDDIAATVESLISRASAAITGQAIVVDAGTSASGR